MAVEKTMEKIVSLAKARGFVYPGSEIYGGLANTWDYLQKDQPQGVQAHDQCRHSDQQHHAPHDGLAFVLVHRCV